MYVESAVGWLSLQPPPRHPSLDPSHPGPYLALPPLSACYLAFTAPRPQTSGGVILGHFGDKTLLPFLTTQLQNFCHVSKFDGWWRTLEDKIL